MKIPFLPLTIDPLGETDSRMAPLLPLSICRTVPPVLVRNVAEMTFASAREAALLPLAKTGKNKSNQIKTIKKVKQEKTLS